MAVPLSPSAAGRSDGDEASTEIVFGDNGDSRGVGGALSTGDIEHVLALSLMYCQLFKPPCVLYSHL